MRFAENADVIPVLKDLPPTDTLVKADGSLSRPDGPHSNNAAVRAAVLERKEQHCRVGSNSQGRWSWFRLHRWTRSLELG